MNEKGQKAIALAMSLGFSRAILLPAELILDHNCQYPMCGIVNDPQKLMPSAKSVLVAATVYPGFLEWPKDCGEVSAFYFASQKAYLALRALQKTLSDHGIATNGQQLLPAKRLGMLAGFGMIGKNTLLQNDQWGSRFALHTLITDIEASPLKERTEAHPCGECTRCIDACPTGALSIEEGFRRERCLRSYMMNGRIPEPYRRMMQNRLLGCEICQRVCPRQPAQSALPAECPGDFAIEKLLLCEPGDLETIGNRVGANEARPNRMRAQAAIIAGNNGNAKYLPILQKLSSDANETVAEHAKWAMHNFLANR